MDVVELELVPDVVERDVVGLVLLGVGGDVFGLLVHDVVVVFLTEDVLVADPEDVHRVLAL